ncbi:hypothetical protein [Kitasatospora kifunensis]|uniref:Uncharacterized protein n=1 Tax=Kitasatospora kifunensis TaxID=58351 RepID=A0A7W7VSQ6_KITKI|nr:hypothetical protein [Kitasatospora kifunensis]MBB4921402.1 hypothetical protein [Kitasatospora kifunensis]
MLLIGLRLPGLRLRGLRLPGRSGSRRLARLLSRLLLDRVAGRRLVTTGLRVPGLLMLLRRLLLPGVRLLVAGVWLLLPGVRWLLPALRVPGRGLLPLPRVARVLLAALRVAGLRLDRRVTRVLSGLPRLLRVSGVLRGRAHAPATTLRSCWKAV